MQKQNSPVFRISRNTISPLSLFLHSIQQEALYYKYLILWFFPEANTEICNQEITEVYSQAIQNPEVANVVITTDTNLKIKQWVQDGGYDSHLHYKSDLERVWNKSKLVPISTESNRYIRSTIVLNRNLECLLITHQADYIKREVANVFRFIDNLNVKSECNE